MTSRRKYRIFFCSFSSALGDMKRKDQRDRLKVLAVLKASPRFSVWDASDNRNIANTMTDLKTDGLIDYPEPQPGYPWSEARVTEAGMKLLEPNVLGNRRAAFGASVLTDELCGNGTEVGACDTAKG